VSISAPWTGGNFSLVQTGTNNGITVAANLTASGNVTLAASGTGSITRSASMTIATGTSSTLTLSSGSGTIGTSGSNLLAVAPNVSISTSGNVYLSDSKAITVVNSFNGGAFNITDTDTTNGSITLQGAVTATGAILLQAGTNGSVTLNDNVSGSSVTLNAAGTGSISLPSAKTLSATGTLSLSCVSCALGSSLNPTLINTPNLSVNTSGNVFISNSQNTTISGASTAGNFTLTQTGTNSGITISANLTASGNATLVATGTGAISRSGSFTITTGATSTLSLSTGSGAIGSSSAPISVNTRYLSANTNPSNTGSVYLSDTATSGTLTLLSSSSGGAFSLSTARSLLVSGPVTVGSDMYSSGSNLSLTAGGSSLEIAGDLTVTGGSITIRNTNTSSGIISFTSAAQVTTLVDKSTATSNGTITIAIGSVPPTAQNPSQSNFPSSIIVTETGGASAYAGSTTGSIVGPASGSANVYAAGRDIIFDAPNSSTQIILGAGVLIKADPPGVVTLTSAHIAVSTSPSDSEPIDEGPREVLITGSLPTSPISPVIPTNSVAPTDVIHAGYVQTSHRAAKNEYSPGHSGMAGASARPTISGCEIVAPRTRTAIRTDFGDLTIGAGAVVLVIATSKILAVYDLHDAHGNNVSLSSNGRMTFLSPGRHVLVTDLGKSYEEVNPLGAIGHRNLQQTDLGNVRLFSSEFSIVSAVTEPKVVAQLRDPHDRGRTSVLNQLLKDAAIIQTTRGASTGYQRYGTRSSYAAATR
jgi:hypothetical protein